MFRRTFLSIKPQLPPFSTSRPHFKTLQPQAAQKSNSNLTLAHIRKIHLTAPTTHKLYVNHENTYAHSILPDLPITTAPLKAQTHVKTLQEFNQFMDHNWRSSNASEIVEAFEKIKDVIVVNEISLSDSRFDKLVDGLMDHCEKLSDDEVIRLLSVLREYPSCDASTSHNFLDVWNCLDDICCWKMRAWPITKMFVFGELWYKLNLGRMSDFVYEMLDRIMGRPQKLTKDMFVYTFFFLNVNRKKDITFDFEFALSQKIHEFNLDELAVIAMGYFKTKTKIKPLPILYAMIEAINKNYETINEVSLAAMLKVIRFSQRGPTAKMIPSMLDKVVTQIPRLSDMSMVHIALAGTTLQVKHEASIKESTKRILENIKNIRVKDIERMLVACSMFNLDTTPSFFKSALKEISKDSRHNEFISYDRCLPSILHYLSFHSLYHYKYLSDILSDDYINQMYGKSGKQVPRELLSLDACIEIECPDYTGNRLSPQKRYKGVKWLTEFTPSEDQFKKLSLSDKVFLELLGIVKGIVGGDKFVYCDHVLPHFSKSDIILCRDKKTGQFVEPFGFENYVLGDVKRPCDLNQYDWLALILMTSNLTVRDSCEPLGSMVMKGRQLKAIGYTPVMICTSQIGGLPPPDRAPFIASLLS